VRLQCCVQRAVLLPLHTQRHPLPNDLYISGWAPDGARLPSRVQEVAVLQPPRAVQCSSTEVCSPGECVLEFCALPVRVLHARPSLLLNYTWSTILHSHVALLHQSSTAANLENTKRISHKFPGQKTSGAEPCPASSQASMASAVAGLRQRGGEHCFRGESCKPCFT